MNKETSNIAFSMMCLLALLLFAVSETGCDKSPCDNVTCENEGTCVDGTCNCPTGYTGTHCEEVDFPYAAGKYFGNSVSIGNGALRPWAEVDGEGNPIAIGINFPEEMLENLPNHTELISIPMPDEAYNTLFDHIFFGWESHGHAPSWWNVPHFDFHFMMVSHNERENVIPGSDAVPLGTKYTPQDYISDGGTVGTVVPRMGVHWWDSTAPEVNGGEFTSTMIYGAYQGQMTFIEPMVSRAYLLSKPSAAFEIKQPTNYLRSGYWPTRYRIIYHADSKEYDIQLEGFIMRIRG